MQMLNFHSMELAEKTKQLFSAINARDTNHAGAARHLAYIRQRMLAQTNAAVHKALYQEIDRCLPSISISRGLIHQFRHAARATSRQFGQPMELSGTCSGTIDNDTWYPEKFHVYHDQVCNKVRTHATPFGKTQTDVELKAQKLRNIITAHSHNIMDCFHSDTDDRTLERNVRDSPQSIVVTHNGNVIHCPYACNIVFNEFVGGFTGDAPANEPYVCAGVIMPEFTPHGRVNRKIIEFKYNGTPKLHYRKTGRISRRDYERIQREVAERVRYQTFIQ